MIIENSKRFMSRSFKKTKYIFKEIPDGVFRENFGIYIHVPFCYSKCSFCPFYKTFFKNKLKDKYLAALGKEIAAKDIGGFADWLYIGGGTPNTLTIEEITEVITKIKNKANIKSMGIELLPSILDKNYLDGLKRCGFNKVSIGIESLSEKVIGKTGRKNTDFENIKNLVDYAEGIGLKVNADMMVGLPKQDSRSFIGDIKLVNDISPNQVTIYPFMIINGLQVEPGLPNREQFVNIEKAAALLKANNYTRSGIWTFNKGGDVYDSSRDELVKDYVGFGPAAFSTYKNYKVVNPGLEGYLNNFKNGNNLGFVAEKTKSTDDWRKFARMLYDLDCKPAKDFPFYINMFITLLRLSGYTSFKDLSKKGFLFVHEITKIVVESLPFPLQNPQCVDNYEDYISYSSKN